MHVQPFLDEVWGYYHNHSRDLLWRHPEADGTFDPYKIMLSEIMLQQTQVGRVTQKYQEFLAVFPTLQSLAAAPLADVLRLWQGLGYNRRAKYLWQAARQITDDLGEVFPNSQQELTKLPGIGLNTAGAICAYAYNQPVAFIETNIRTVFIHHFFKDRDDVHDNELTPLIKSALQIVVNSHEQPREFYWAVMDYGTHLKATVGNVSRSSKHYAKQSTFKGSRRQIRGQVLRLLAAGKASSKHMEQQIADPRLPGVLQDLLSEGLIEQHGKQFGLATSVVK